jgi:hypothetical protein
MWSTAATSSTPSLAGPISATPSSWIFVGRMDFPANKGSGSDAASLITGSGAFKNVPRSIFGFARDDSDDSGGRAMTQVKNSLGRDDLASLSYRIDSTQITTRKGIATTGKFVFLGESERSVADVLRDSRSSLDEYELADRSDAESWLDKYLLDNGGTAEAKTVIAAGESQRIQRQDDQERSHQSRKAQARGLRQGQQALLDSPLVSHRSRHRSHRSRGSEAGTYGTCGGTYG